MISRQDMGSPSRIMISCLVDACYKWYTGVAAAFNSFYAIDLSSPSNRAPLTANPIEVNLRDNSDRTALFHALEAGHDVVVATLLSLSSNIDVNIQDIRGRQPLRSLLSMVTTRLLKPFFPSAIPLTLTCAITKDTHPLCWLREMDTKTS